MIRKVSHLSSVLSASSFKPYLLVIKAIYIKESKRYSPCVVRGGLLNMTANTSQYKLICLLLQARNTSTYSELAMLVCYE